MTPMIQIRSNYLYLCLYLLFIVYGSLFPLADWRTPEHKLLEVWQQAMGQHLSRSDLLTNFLVYIPLGFLLSSVCSTRFGTLARVMLVVTFGFLISFSMEYLQLFLPARSSSPVDLLLNTLSTLSGAIAYRWLGNKSTRGEWFGEWCHNHFHPGRVTDIGLTVIAIWGGCATCSVCPFSGCR